MTDDVFFAPLTELNDRLKKREFSCVELVRAFAQRLEGIGRRYNAVAVPMTESALRRAKEVDDEFKRERLRGVLQGIPYGAKDLLAFPGQPTTWGARAYAAQVLNETATVLEKLDKTGAVLTAKLAMAELGADTTASLFGPGLNPWDRTRWSGGSSAESVAAGLVPFAIGSETSDNLINSASCCGITSLRPTYGLVSRHGAMARAWTMDKIGPLCHSAEDCGLVLQTIAGGDSQDPGTAGKSFYYTPQFARKLSDLKVGLARGLTGPWQAAAEVIRATGVQSVEFSLPDFPWDGIAQTVIGAESASVFEPLIEGGQAPADLKAGLDILANDYLKAMRIRSLVKQRFREIFGDMDLIVAPARNGPAPRVSEAPDPLNPYTLAGNLAGLPAVSMPCGFENNLPLGLQLIGPAFAENTLLAVAREFQQRTDWHKRKPPVELLS